MITINTQYAFAVEDILFTFALADEAAAIFTPYSPLICGIGKVAATYNFMRAIQTKQPSLFAHLCSAGSSHCSRGEIVCCTYFNQRDMYVRGLGFAHFDSPLSGLP